MTNLYLISGFLGAGKTTLIQKLLKDAFSDSQTAVIENDFGEIGIDAALLRTNQVTVREINAGCICCSLAGDFVSALVDLLQQFSPDNVLIEPSGVGKLSEIQAGCQDPRVASLATVRQKITLVDVQHCQLYLKNFGEFFEDQIRYADTILLTHPIPTQVQAAYHIVQQLNPSAKVIQTPMEQLQVQDLITVRNTAGCSAPQVQHEHHCHCAESTFETITLETKHCFTRWELKRCLTKAAQLPGQLLRAKGIVLGSKSCWQIQYLPDHTAVNPCTVQGSSLCLIGKKLNRAKLQQIFFAE